MPVGRWIDTALRRQIEASGDFDAGAALDELRARARELRFPRLPVSSIDEHGYHVLRLRREGVAARRDPRNAFATQIVHASGIRAHELLTLGRPGEQPPDDRRERSHLTGTAAEGMKFAGRNGVVYTVVGKGGLVREVLLLHQLAECLEERRLDAPAPVVDRSVRYLQRQDIGGEHAFSVSFSRASIEALGKSRGAHGLRHRFAQERMREPIHHAEHRLTLAVVSEEMGHLRPDVTVLYCL